MVTTPISFFGATSRIPSKTAISDELTFAILLLNAFFSFSLVL